MAEEEAWGGEAGWCSWLAGLQLGCVTLGKFLELSEPLLSHSFFCRVGEPRCGNRLCPRKRLCRGEGPPFPGALSHDPFLPPFLSDPCGHVTLKRNVLASFKDHCPGARARSAHTPTQRTQTIAGRQGRQASLLRRLPMQWGQGGLDGTLRVRWGRRSGNGVGASSPLFVICLFPHLLHLAGTDYLCPRAPYRGALSKHLLGD